MFEIFGRQTNYDYGIMGFLNIFFRGVDCVLLEVFGRHKNDDYGIPEHGVLFQGSRWPYVWGFRPPNNDDYGILEFLNKTFFRGVGCLLFVRFSAAKQITIMGFWDSLQQNVACGANIISKGISSKISININYRCFGKPHRLKTDEREEEQKRGTK